jgi:hypothetical protein
MNRLHFELDEFDYSPMEIELIREDLFLVIRETLARIGVLSKRTNILWQSCHILQKGGKFYLVHFKELFALDGKKTDLTDNDIERRNRIAKMLEDWGLIKIITVSQLYYLAPSNEINVIAFKDKHKYDLKTKYLMTTHKIELSKIKESK